MVTLVCSSRVVNKEYLSKLIIKSGVKPNDITVLHYENNGQYSLSELYNRGLNESKDDYVVFMHDDLKLGKNWLKKTITHLSNSDYGILGVAGTWNMGVDGRWWTKREAMMGQVYHEKDGKKWLSKYCGDMKNYITEAVIVDGLYFAVNKSLIKINFNEKYDGFHFYDVTFCIENFLRGVKIGIMYNIEITHLSIGETNEKWELHRQKFVSEYSNNLPLVANNTLIIPEVKQTYKKNYKLSIVILHKDKNDLLFKCIDSIFNKTNYKNFEIIVGDTGSSEDKLMEIENKYGNKIKLINIGKYKFAKNNNDLVKDYISKDTELLLFCNNDIELLNDAITEMVNTYELNKFKVGTVGARLHYGDDTLQHGGMILCNSEKSGLIITHAGLKTRYGYNLKTSKVIGNTGGFLMINRLLFDKIGGFNESYTECFEDVELNISAKLIGKDNLFCSTAVCYHYESQTRNDNNSKIERIQDDYVRFLQPYILKQYNKISDLILNIE
jgi:GT2 family glycosyltransferase